MIGRGPCPGALAALVPEPTNDSAFKTMSGGWTKVVQKLGTVAGELH